VRCAADLGHVPLVIELELWRQREVEPAKARGEELFLPSDSRTLTQPAHLPSATGTTHRRYARAGREGCSLATRKVSERKIVELATSGFLHRW
jgi:hypothetical protein